MDKHSVALNAFNETAAAYQQKFGDLQLYRHAFEAFSSCCNDRDRILDVGCGPGNVVRFLLSRNDTLRITGVDFAPEMIRLAQQTVPGASFEVQDMLMLELSTQYFDSIVASFCLPFLYNDEAAALLERLSGMLNSGGHMYVSTMKGNTHRLEKTSFGGDTTFFFNYYTREFLLSQFRQNHLQIIKEWTQDYCRPDGTVECEDMIFILKKQRPQ